VKDYSWKESYNLGVPIIDRAHKKVFSVIQKMVNLLDEEDFLKHQHACIEGMKYVSSHMETHFEEEEEYMRSVDYANYEIHKRQHDRARYELFPALEADVARSGFDKESIRRLLGIGIGWLTAHMNEDLAIVGRGMNYQIYKDIPNQVAFIEKLSEVVIRVAEGTFQEKVRLLDENYRGQDFGDSISFECLYRSADGKQSLRMIVILEKRFVMFSTGMLFGEAFKEMNEMVVSASEEMTQMLFAQISSQFRNEENAMKLIRNQKIGTEIVREYLEKKPPAYGLLFGTDYGYFAMCAYYT